MPRSGRRRRHCLFHSRLLLLTLLPLHSPSTRYLYPAIDYRVNMLSPSALFRPAVNRLPARALSRATIGAPSQLQRQSLPFLQGKRYISVYGYTQAKALVYSKHGEPKDVLQYVGPRCTPELERASYTNQYCVDYTNTPSLPPTELKSSSVSSPLP